MTGRVPERSCDEIRLFSASTAKRNIKRPRAYRLVPAALLSAALSAPPGRCGEHPRF
jgi:hypothetical protein